jgi:hypothetical protein
MLIANILKNIFFCFRVRTDLNYHQKEMPLNAGYKSSGNCTRSSKENAPAFLS